MRLQIAACVLLLSSSALAQQAPSPSPQFTREFDAGVDAFRLGKFAEARDHFEKAKAFEPKLPGPYRRLAEVDQAESKFADCVNNARTAMMLNPKSSEMPDTVKLHDACRASLGRPVFTFSANSTGGAIAVSANVEGASVTLNGLKYGATPLAPREVVAGDADIGVTKVGYLPGEQKVQILIGVVTDVDFTLEKDPNYKDTGDGNGGGKPSVPTTGFLSVTGAPGAIVKVDGAVIAFDKDGRLEQQPGVHEVEIDATGMESWRRRVRIARGQKTTLEVELTSSDDRSSSHGIGLALVTTGAVLAAGGAGTGIYSYRQTEIAHDWVRIEQTRPAGSLPGSADVLPVHTRADIDAQNNKAKTWAIASDIAVGAAAVSIGVGVYYLLKDRPEERPGEPPPFAIAPIIGHGADGFVVEKEVRW